MNLRERFRRWYAIVSSTPWASWLSHGVLALALVAIFRQPLAIASFYVLREVEQAGLEFLYLKPIPVWDHVLDALIPVLVVTLWSIL